MWIIVQCEDCSFYRSMEIDIDELAWRETPLGYSRGLTDKTRSDLLSLWSDIYKHFKGITHKCIFDCTDNTYNICRRTKVKSDVFEETSKHEFTKLLIDYVSQFLFNVIRIKHEQELIDSLVISDEDRMLLERLKAQGANNEQIIRRLYNKHNKVPVAIKEGQTHLELDENTIESTGKSVSIDDVLAKIDEHLNE